MNNVVKLKEHMARFFTSVDFLVKLVEQGEPTAAEKIAIDVKKSMEEAEDSLSFFIAENINAIETLKETIKGLLEERADEVNEDLTDEAEDDITDQVTEE